MCMYACVNICTYVQHVLQSTTFYHTHLPCQPSPPTPPPPTGISDEEADELRSTIDELRDEVTQTRLNLGKVETANSKLSQFKDCEINFQHPMTGLIPRSRNNSQGGVAKFKF